MSRAHLIWLHVSTILSAATGIVFAVMKYLLTTSDEFAVANHPLQPHMLAAHVVIAPVLVFVLGWTFANHILPKYRYGDDKNRRSGTSSMWLIAPMTLSAYLLQIATNETLRQTMAVAHWVTSGLFVIAYVAHVVVARRMASPSS
jgi:hypothetical protein